MYKFLIVLVLVHKAIAQSSMQDLIQNLKAHGILQSPEVEEVLQKLDRKYFVAENPYEDNPQPIGYGATISAPHMHVLALELLKGHLKNAAKCLDVGYGSGYMTAAMRLLMKNYENAVVFGIEHVRDLLVRAEDNVVSAGLENLIMDYKLVFITDDGRKGLKRQKPFSCIHVGAAFNEYPKVLEDQLSKGGRMVVPVGEGFSQKLLVVDKDRDGKITKQEITDVAFVHMTDLERQCQECNQQEQERLRLVEENYKKSQEGLEFDFNFDDL